MAQFAEKVTIKPPATGVSTQSQIIPNATEAAQPSISPIDKYFRPNSIRNDFMQNSRAIPELTIPEAKGETRPKLREKIARCTVKMENVFSVPELADHIVESVSIQDICSLNLVSREFHHTVRAIIRSRDNLFSERFLRNRFGDSRWMLNSKIALTKLGDIENLMLRAKKGLGSTPIAVPDKVKFEAIRAQGAVLEAPTTGGLSVEWNADRTVSFISTLGGNIYHTCEGQFLPKQLYANGTFCLGYEDGNKVVRRVSDWERMAVLPTDPADTGRSDLPTPSNVEKLWASWGFSKNRLICAYMNGRKSGAIEVYDELARECQTTWHHSGMTDIFPQHNYLTSFDRAKGFVKVFTLGRKDNISEFAVGNHVQRIFPHGEFISFAWGSSDAEIVQTYAVVDGSLNEPFSKSLTGPVGYRMRGLNESKDQSIVVQYHKEGIVPGPYYHYRFISPHGQHISSFSTQPMFMSSKIQPVLFLTDRFIVTYGDSVYLNIRSKTGEILFEYTNYLDEILVNSGLGELIGVRSCLDSDENGTLISRSLVRWS